MPAAEDVCPFVGLQPYTDAERDYFFGRERDQRVISSNLYAASLTILYGESGVGKSSVLLAGVVPYLRSQPRSAVVVFREWQRPDFLDAIKSECLKAVELARQQPLDIAPSLPLDDLLCASAQALGGTILVLFDQFEEYFLYHPDSDAPFDSEFARAVNREDVDAGFLVAIREDALAKLDRFRARIPSLLGNTLRLQHLSAADAEAAIRKPLDVFNARASEGAPPVLIEDELVRSVLAQVRTGQVSLGQSTGVGQAQTGEDTTRIEAPFLQLVMTHLWEEERNAHSHMLRASTLQRLGGAQQIVASHLDSVMTRLDAVQQEVCSRFFDRLVTPSGSKIACGDDDLTKWAGDLASHVPVVLQTLSDRRLLRGVAGPADRPQAQRFEIFHDVLAPAVLAWRTRYIGARERAEAERRAEEHRRRTEEQAKVAKRLRRLSFGLLAVVVLAVGAAGLAVVSGYAAAYQMQFAIARNLAGQSRLHFHDQFDLALLLGIEAERQLPAPLLAPVADTEPTEESRSNLFDDLLADLGVHRATEREFTEEARSNLFDALLANPFVETYLHGVREFTSVAFSPDAKTLATGGAGGTAEAEGRVILWDVKTHRPLGPPLASAGPVFAVAFSPDGETLASGGCEDRMKEKPCEQGEIRIWDVASREPSGQSLTGHAGAVKRLAFSQDGRTLGSGAPNPDVGDDSVILWNVRTREILGPPLTGGSLAFSPDEKTLASAGCGRRDTIFGYCMQGEIRFWDVLTREPTDSRLGAHKGLAIRVAFSPDGKILASVGADGTLILWNTVTRQALAPPLRGHAGVGESVAFSPDGKTLASGSADNSVVLWDLSTRQPLGAPLIGHTDFVADLAFSPDGRSLASASGDGSVILWNLGTHLRGQAGRLTAIGFSPDGKTLTTIGDDNTMLFWNVATRRFLGPLLTEHKSKIVRASFTRDGKIMALADEEGTLMLWDVATRMPLGPALTQNSATSAKIQDLDFSPDGRILAAGGVDKMVVLWDVASRQSLGPPLSGHDAPVTYVAFSPDGETLLSTGLDGTMILWDVDTRQLLGSLAHEGSAAPVRARFSPDSKLLVSGKRDGTVMFWDVATRQALGPAFTGNGDVRDLAFSPDGKTFASMSNSGGVVLWDVAAHRRLGPWFYSPTWATEIRFSPDSKVLTVWGLDNKVTLWDIATRRPLGRPISGENGVALSDDFKTVASLGNDGILLRDLSFLADASRESWRARACTIANRNLTRAEWAFYVGARSGIELHPYRATCPGLPLSEETGPKAASSGQ